MLPSTPDTALRRRAWIVYLLIAANIVTFLYQISLTDSQSLIFTLRNAIVPRAFFEPVWGIYNGIRPGDYWPFITSVFMHGGWLHLGLNMWALFLFGPALEERYGHIPFLLFYLACGILAGAAHTYLNKQSSLPLLGASGAISGVIAAFAALYPRQRLIIFPIPIPAPVWFFAAAFFALQVYQGVQELVNPIQSGGIAWWAHIGGFLAGLALLPLLILFRPAPRDTQGPWAATPEDDEPPPSPPPAGRNWERGPWG